MNKFISNFLNLTEKLYLIIYQITLVFAILFYILLKGATGHKFIITHEEVTYSLIMFLAFILSGFYRERVRFNKGFNRVILWIFLFLTIATLGMSLYFFFFSITFDYEFWENPIMILFTGFLIPIVFTWCNFYLTRKIAKVVLE